MNEGHRKPECGKRAILHSSISVHELLLGSRRLNSNKHSVYQADMQHVGRMRNVLKNLRCKQ